MTSERRAPSTLFASLRVFDISLGEMLWSRRTVFMGLVVGLPVLLAAIVRLLHELGAPGMPKQLRISPRESGPSQRSFCASLPNACRC